MILASIFRDSTDYLGRYFSQVAALREYTDVQLIVAEGDSTDDTFDRLRENLHPLDVLVKVDHGGEKYGSIDHPQRWDDIAKVVRAVLSEYDGLEPLVWVESDLIWEPQTITALLSDLTEVPAVSPMVFWHGRFYDVWGYRKDGVRFRGRAPYFDADESGLVKIDSCGSCFAVRNDDLLYGWDGKWPFTANGNLYVDTRLEIQHP